MGSQATKPRDLELSASSAGAQRASSYLIGTRVLNGEIHRNSFVSRSDIDSLSKRFNRLWGSPSITTGGMNRAHIDRQNGVLGKSSRHHVRQRLSVRAGMFSSWHSAWPEPLPGGERSINTTAKYTRRPAKRTDGDVERVSHRAQVKLRRWEYSSRTAAGQPRGLRG
jgi:hypothetical protein